MHLSRVCSALLCLCRPCGLILGMVRQEQAIILPHLSTCCPSWWWSQFCCARLVCYLAGESPISLQTVKPIFCAEAVFREFVCSRLPYRGGWYGPVLDHGQPRLKSCCNSVHGRVLPTSWRLSPPRRACLMPYRITSSPSMEWASVLITIGISRRLAALK